MWGFFFILISSVTRCGPVQTQLLAMIKGIFMAYKPWWVQAAEINSQHERDEFVKGVFGQRPKEKQPLFAALLVGTGVAYAAGARRHAKKAKKK